ncbi:zinc finger protein 16 [Elysia marginata]|uniref:Zinc finger protein 16 n=1 Tax=Elysia marginata TaxID=1093978 RepID=A0AAV4HBQ8_9GAST|nr:zinc finger protein 16 [Elysia marginata]
MTDVLQDSWKAFCKDQQMLGNPFAIKDGTFSLILDALGENFSEVYKACGFIEAQFGQLHQLLVKAEQQCLLSLFVAFHNYRSLSTKPQARLVRSTEKPAPANVNLEVPHSPCNTVSIPTTIPSVKMYGEASKNRETDDAMSEKLVSNVGRKQLSVSLRKSDDPASAGEKTRPTISENKVHLKLDDLEMGRGKRKKYAKLQFDMFDDKLPKKSATGTRKVGLPARDDKMRDIASLEPAIEDKECEVNVCKKKKISVSQESLVLEKEEAAEQNINAESRTVLHNCSRISNDTKTVHASLNPDTSDSSEVEKKDSPGKSHNRLSVSAASDCEEDTLSFSEATKSKIKRTARSKSDQDEMAGERTDFDCDDLAPIKCSYCKIQLPRSRDLFRHWKQEHKNEEHDKPLNLFYCDVCHKSFDAPRKFKLHYRIHSGARPHACKLCGKKFRICKGLKDHLLCHTNERPFACSQCPKRFISKKLLNQHVKVHKNENEPRVCELCGKQYQSLLGLKLHYRVHAGIRPHKCDVCGMAFTQRCSLQIHKRLHTGDKRHICDVCGWRFNTNNALVTHRRVHTGERPYKCSQCSFTAASSSCLRDHEIVHSSAKPFKCNAPDCNKYFKRQAHLMMHLKKKHAGLKPYACKLCGARFAMVSQLLLHQKSDACDGGRIKREPTPEPEFKSAKTSSEPLSTKSARIVMPNQQVQTVAILENQEDLKEIDSPQIFVKRKQKYSETPAQEFEISHVTEFPYVEENQIVIHVVSEPGTENTEVVLSEEEMAAIVRLSQQM